MPVGHQAKIADALKARRQRVNQKAPDELFGIECHSPGLVAVFAAIVLPLEGDTTFGDAEDAVVRQCYTMRVTAQILNSSLRASEGLFCVNDPFGFFERIEPAPEDGLVFKRRQFTEERQLVIFESPAETLEENPAEQARQHAHGQKEAGKARDPLAIGTDAASGNDEVNVGMVPKPPIVP